jgi:excisionase family DNA binding protein
MLSPSASKTRRPLLTVEEFAAALNVRPKTVRDWVLERRYPFVRVGRLVRFRPEVLDGLIECGEVPARLRRTHRRTHEARPKDLLGIATAPFRADSGGAR